MGTTINTVLPPLPVPTSHPTHTPTPTPRVPVSPPQPPARPTSNIQCAREWLLDGMQASAILSCTPNEKRKRVCEKCLGGCYARLSVSSVVQSAPSILRGRQVHLPTAIMFSLSSLLSLATSWPGSYFIILISVSYLGLLIYFTPGLVQTKELNSQSYVPLSLVLSLPAPALSMCLSL